jgi:hypothetical protein
LEHGPLLKKLPAACVRQWIAANRDSLSDFARADRLGDDEAMHVAFVSHLSNFNRYLQRSGVRGKGKRAARQISHRIARGVQERLTVALEQDANTGPPHASYLRFKPLSPPFPPLDPDQLKIKKCLGALQDYGPSKAIQALGKANFVDFAADPEAADYIRDLFPSEGTPLPPLPDSAPFVTVTSKDVAKAGRLLDNGSASDGQGKNGHLVRKLLVDPECLDGITAIVNRTNNGTLPVSLAPYLLHVNGHCTYKDRPREPDSHPDHDPDKKAVRPRVTCDTYRRLTALCSTSPLKHAIRRETAGNDQHRQFGSVPDGPVKAKFLVEEALRRGECVISADIGGAFTNIRRAWVLKVLFATAALAATHRFIHFTYSNTNRLYLRDRNRNVVASFDMPEGLHQGDVPASWLFDLAFTNFLTTLRINPAVYTVLVHDDTHVLGPTLREAFEGFGTMHVQLKRIGLGFEPSKSTAVLFALNFTIPPSIQTQIDGLRMKVATDLYKINGSFLSPHRQSYLSPDSPDTEPRNTQIALRLADEAESFVEILRLVVKLPTLEALTILRYTQLHVKVVHLLRAHPAEDTHLLNTRLDALTRKCLAALLHTVESKLSERLLSFCRLPFRNNGISLFRSALLSDPAFLSAVISFLVHEIDAGRGFHPSVTLTADINAALSRTRALITEKDLLPATTDLIPQHFSQDSPSRPFLSKLQKHLTIDIHGTVFAKAVKDHAKTPALRAALASAKVKWSSSFLTLPPHPDVTPLNPEHAHLALTHRLHTPPLSLPEHFTCPCDCSVTPDNFWQHVLSCPHLIRAAKFGFVRRHDMLRDALILLIKAVGGWADREPRPDPRNPSVGPDIYALLAGEAFLLDLNITHTYSPAYVTDGTAFSSASVLGKVHKRKHNDYDAQAAQAGAKFHTFCLNTHGGLHSEALSFCKLLATFATRWD